MFMYMYTTEVFSLERNVRIYDIFQPDSFEMNYLILASDSEVYEINSKNLDLIKLAYSAFEKENYVAINFNDFKINKLLSARNKIEKITLKSVKENIEMPSDILYQSIPTPMDNYDVSSIDTIEDVNDLFKTQNNNTRWRSQCYNRAHVWVYELSKKSFSGKKLKLGKNWMFFTRKYIREFRYKWWFHVTPYINIKNENEDIILDREFTKKPTLISEWKNIFIRNKADCPVVEYYSHYRDFQWDNYCYFIKSNMYYWQPYNIENLEKGKSEKVEWSNSELRHAYRNAIKYWDGQL